MQSLKKYIDLYATRDCKLVETFWENNEKIVKTVGFSWYFLILKEDYDLNDKVLMKLLSEYKRSGIKYKTEDEKWVRVYCKYQDRLRVIDKFKSLKIQTYEADLSIVRRYWLDKNCQIADPEQFALLFIDIEVDDTIGGLDIGKDKIISFSAKANTGEEFQFINENERQLLDDLISLLTKYDIIIGWNSRKYDIPYILARCQIYGIEFPNICHIDMMHRMIHAYRFDTNIRSFSLNNIANKFLGESKVERTTKIIDLYKNDFETFKLYNLTDVRLLYNLNDKFKIIDILLKQIYWCNVTPRSLGQEGKGLYTLLDNLILRETHKRGQKGLSPKYSYSELDEMTKEELSKLDYPGGLVLPAIPGLYTNVYIFDFKTLYPSMILTSNIGFDTLDENGDIKNPSGTRFKSEPQSVLATVVSELMTKRKEYKEKKLQLLEEGKKSTPEYAAVEADEVIVKELGNSVYGICGARWGRYFSKREVVESITLMGQYLLNTLKDFFKEFDYTIITGDTDSIIISTPKTIDVNKHIDRYQEYLERRLLKDCNIIKSYISLAFDRYFDKFIIVAKKNYVGHLVNQEGRSVDYIHIRGLEAVKSDTCPLAKKTVRELIESLVRTDKIVTDYVEWLTLLRHTIFKNVTREELSIHKKIPRELSSYKVKPLSVVIAEKKVERDGFLLHKEIEYVVTGRKNDVVDGKNRNRLTGIETSLFEGHFDEQYYWDHLILPNCTRLLSAVFPKIGWKDMTYNSFYQTKLNI